MDSFDTKRGPCDFIIVGEGGGGGGGGGGVWTVAIELDSV